MRAERDAAAVLEALVSRHLLNEDAGGALRADAALPEPVHGRALEWLAVQPEDSKRLIDAAWAIVRSPGQPLDRYGYALRLAEIVNRQSPHDGQVLVTSGVAQYRLGKYADAAASLTRSAALSKDQPTDFAFLAMALHRLGKSDESHRALDRSRELAKNPERFNERTAAENKQFLAEAEALIEPPGVRKEGPGP
jgi:predicted Zn-dependent protease